MRRLLALFLLLVTAAGCDSGGLRADDVRRAFIYELVLEDFPARQADGDDWDSGVTQPEPDVYLVLETEGGFVLAETDPFANLEGRDLPIVYGIPEVEVDLDEDLYLVAYDDDGLLDDEFMDEIGPFRMRDFLTSSLDESARLFSDDGVTEVRLRFEWDD